MYTQSIESSIASFLTLSALFAESYGLPIPETSVDTGGCASVRSIDPSSVQPFRNAAGDIDDPVQPFDTSVDGEPLSHNSDGVMTIITARDVPTDVSINTSTAATKPSSAQVKADDTIGRPFEVTTKAGETYTIVEVREVPEGAQPLTDLQRKELSESDLEQITAAVIAAVTKDREENQLTISAQRYMYAVVSVVGAILIVVTLAGIGIAVYRVTKAIGELIIGRAAQQQQERRNNGRNVNGSHEIPLNNLGASQQ
jgi:hypothetical protein